MRSGDTQAASDAKDTNSFISFLQTFLLVVRGRRALRRRLRDRELALDHDRAAHARVRDAAHARRLAKAGAALGHPRGARRSGVVASVVGLFLGLALAKGLFKLFDAVGFTLPNNGLTFETRTIVVSLLVGILVTLLASLRPALRATRVPPIAAVREGATLPPGRFHRFRGVGAAAHRAARLRGASLRALRERPRDDAGAALDGSGALLIFVGVALFSSRLVVPLARVLGWPATRIGGAAGALARDNAGATRSAPRRRLRP